MKSTPVFGKSFATFKEAFPTVKSVQVNVIERKLPGHVAQAFTERDMPPRSDCSNPSCQGGGMQLDVLIAKMVLAGKVDLEKRTRCNGNEVMTKNETRPCLHSFTVVIHLEYLP